MRSGRIPRSPTNRHKTADVLIVGAGVTGMSVAAALTKVNAKVLVIEQFWVGHGRGSSHGSTRIFRYAYANPTAVRRAQEALRLWRELEQETSEELVVAHGALDIGKDFSAQLAALRACGARFELLDPRTIAEQFDLHVNEDLQGLFQPDGGILNSEQAQRALLRGAIARGALLREGSKVVRFEAGRAGVSAATSDGETLQGRTIVITAGPWAPQLLNLAGFPLAAVPTRETVVYFARRTARHVPGIVDAMLSPEAARLAGPDGAYYLLPDPEHGLKAGLHHSGTRDDPDTERPPDERVVRCVADWVNRHNVADPVPVKGETCFYTNTPDDRFVIESHGRVVVGSACNGTGFKFAPIVGARLAELAIEAIR